MQHDYVYLPVSLIFQKQFDPMNLQFVASFRSEAYYNVHINPHQSHSLLGNNMNDIEHDRVHMDWGFHFLDAFRSF